MSRIDGAAVQAAQTGQPDRQQAEAKQRKWLFELEHALLAMGMKKQGREQARGAADSPQPHAQAQGERLQDEVAQPVQATAPVTAAAAPAAPAAENRAAAVGGTQGAAPAALAAAGTAASGPAAPSADVAAGAAFAAAAGRTAQPHAGPSMGSAVDGAAVQDTAAAGMAEATAETDTAQSAQAVVGGPGPGLTAMAETAPAASAQGMAVQPGTAQPQSAVFGAQRGNAAAGGTDGGVSAPQALRPARAGVLFAAPGMATAEQQEPVALQESAPEQLEAQQQPDAAPEQAEAEPFEKRLMHLYHGTDGVQAWIRDVELNAAQARALAQVLASELGGNGARLAALTVNGRKIVASEQAEGAPARHLQDVAADSGEAGEPEANFIREI